MALREFRDGRGVEWRVWATTPDALHSGTMREYALGEYQDGWLTFECDVERKRLAPFPKDWDMLPDVDLERCCERAKAPRPRKAAMPPSPQAEAPTDPPKGATRSALDSIAPSRTFTRPDGRLWRVAEHVSLGDVAPDGGARGFPEAESTARYFLRFTCDGDVLELDTYPMAWARLPDAQLVKLVRLAERGSAPSEPHQPLASTTDAGSRDDGD
jgi:hypothetical protein